METQPLACRNRHWVDRAGLGRLAGGLLFGVPPVHIPTFLTVALVLLLVSVLAALGPARKAGRSDPMNALRAE